MRREREEIITLRPSVRLPPLPPPPPPPPSAFELLLVLFHETKQKKHGNQPKTVYARNDDDRWYFDARFFFSLASRTSLRSLSLALFSPFALALSLSLSCSRARNIPLFRYLVSTCTCVRPNYLSTTPISVLLAGIAGAHSPPLTNLE